jgi:N6-L-threonylcarbamoyladenine synthase
MGQTRDDAAGEAFDKVAKTMGLGYPGGLVIDELSQDGDPERIHFPRAFLDKTGFDFSFSGIKTAVACYVRTQQVAGSISLGDIAAAFQEAVVDVLVQKAILAVETKRCERLAVVGGVACNRRLRERIKEEAVRAGISVHIPRPELCSDNGAMIAAMGYRHLSQGKTASMDLDAYSKGAKV